MFGGTFLCIRSILDTETAAFAGGVAHDGTFVITFSTDKIIPGIDTEDIMKPARVAVAYGICIELVKRNDRIVKPQSKGEFWTYKIVDTSKGSNAKSIQIVGIVRRNGTIFISIILPDQYIGSESQFSLNPFIDEIVH